MDTFDRISELLRKNNMTQADLARKTGISTGLISQWKNRAQNPSAEKLQKVAECFNVSVDYLLGNEQKEKPAQTVQVRDEHDNIVVFDDETRDLIDSLRSKPEMKMLFSVSKGATKEDIIKAVKIIEALKDNEEEGNH
ncbi:MAG: helix-turn-helix transcriptional regulator [Ruminococcaceae bacterium]|nr:helix-turn-helix transcriptional regulator [Oscillospiraceae bacterium]